MLIPCSDGFSRFMIANAAATRSHAAALPFNRMPGTPSRSRSSRPPRKPATRSASAAISDLASRQASPSPTISGAGNVPDRSPPLLPATGKQRRQPDARAAADEQRAYPFRSIQLVTADGGQIDLPAGQVERDLARRLRQVGVEQAPACFAIDASPARSWITPVSLFTAMTLTSRVGVCSASRSVSGSSSPSDPTGRNTGSNPSAARSATDSRTHLCSVATVRSAGARFPRLAAIRAAPLIAMLFDSVAPEVKMISRASAAISSATCARACFDGRFRLAAHHVLHAMGVAVVLREPRQHRFDYARVTPRGGLIIEIDGRVGTRWQFHPSDLGSGGPRSQTGTQPGSYAWVCGDESVDIRCCHVPWQRHADRLACQGTQPHC